MRLIAPPAQFAPPLPRRSRPGAGGGLNLEAAWARWRRLEAAPLHVVAHLASPPTLGADGSVHLDSVLSMAVLASCGPLAAQPLLDDCVVPLPLGLAWISEAGWPVWASSDLIAAGTTAVDVAYVHKRYPDHREPLQRERGANTSAGRWKDWRLPQRLTVCERMEAWAFGDAVEVSALLERVSHVGKKAAHGRGRVARWEVTLAPGLLLDTVLERRPMPVAAFHGDAQVQTRRLARAGYTPPYWDARRFDTVRVAAHG